MTSSHDPFEPSDLDFEPSDRSDSLNRFENRLKKMVPRPLRFDFDSVVGTDLQPQEVIEPAARLSQPIDKNPADARSQSTSGRPLLTMSLIAASWFFGAFVGGMVVHSITPRELRPATPLVLREPPTSEPSPSQSSLQQEKPRLEQSDSLSWDTLLQWTDPIDPLLLQHETLHAGSMIRSDREKISKRSGLPGRSVGQKGVSPPASLLPSAGIRHSDSKDQQEILGSREMLLRELQRGG